MFFEIYRPNPVPVLDFVVNLVNNLGNTSGSMPGPVSFILTIALWSLCIAITLTLPWSVNLIALLKRFDTIWLILLLSASTRISFLGSIYSRFRLLLLCSLLSWF